MAGCSRMSMQARRVQSSGRITATENNLLTFSNHIDSFSTRQLGIKLEHARRRFANQSSGYNRLRLVLLLMKPGTAITDYGEAHSLLTQYVDHGPYTMEDRTLVPLATFLLLTVDTRRDVVNALNTEKHNRKALQKKIDRIKAVEGGYGHSGAFSH
jgi:hypothetical protein